MDLTMAIFQPVETTMLQHICPLLQADPPQSLPA
jgi:hypothetical protein